MTDTASPDTRRDGAVPAQVRRPAAGETVRRHGVVVGAVVLLSLLAGWGTTQAIPETYTTQTKVLLRAQAEDGAVSVADAAAYVADQADTYAALVETPTVLDPAISAAGSDVDSATLAERVSASVVPQTTIVDVDVSAPRAREAAELAGAVARSLVDQVSTQSEVGGQALMTGVVVEEPLIPTDPESPNLLVNLAVALAIGLAVSAAVVALREGSARSRHARR
ncbi:YveK family protein [Kineococcus sp. SYSU DK006]|uniref:YveK family protein n=1 Tax=Kineococcus sp. SYSU DK006 TaxID=3383127 RepID=UPI003D7F129F